MKHHPFTLILLLEGLYIGELNFQSTDRARQAWFFHTKDQLLNNGFYGMIQERAEREHVVIVHEVSVEELASLTSTVNDDLLSFYGEEWFGDERIVTMAEAVLAADRRMQLYLKHPTLDKLSGLQAFGETIYVPVKAARVQGLNPLLGEYIALRKSQVREDQLPSLQKVLEERLRTADLEILEWIDHLNAQPIAPPADVQEPQENQEE